MNSIKYTDNRPDRVGLQLQNNKGRERGLKIRVRNTVREVLAMFGVFLLICLPSAPVKHDISLKKLTKPVVKHLELQIA